MRFPARLASRTLLACALPLAGLAGCQVPAPVGPPPVAAPQGPRAPVSVDAGAIARGWRGKLLTDDGLQPFERLTQLRLRVLGPGVGDLAPVTIAWSPTADAPVAATLTMQVPAGPNRVFVLEALNAGGHVLHRIRGVAPVAAGEPLALTMNALTDAAGRTLEALLAAPPGAETDLRPLLATTDVAARLPAYVNRYTRYSATYNAYAGVQPDFFDAPLLAARLRARGLAFLDEADDAALELMHRGGLALAVVNQDGRPVADAEVHLFAPGIYKPGYGPVFTQGGEAFLHEVPLGTWEVLVVHGGSEVWDTLTIATAETHTKQLVLQTGPVVVPDVSTLAGSLEDPDFALQASLRGDDGTLSGAALGAIAATDDGRAYYALHGQIWRESVGSHTRIYRARGYDLTMSEQDAPFADPTAMATDAEGNLYVAAQAPDAVGHKVYKFAADDLEDLFGDDQLVPAVVGRHTFDGIGQATTAMQVHGGYLYLASGRGVTRLPLADTSGAAPSEIVYDGGFSTSFSGLAIRPGSGEIYLSDLARHAVYQVTGPGSATRVAGLETSGDFGGDASGAALTEARFDQPASLAAHPTEALLYVADTGNHRLKVIDLAAGTVAPYSGAGLPVGEDVPGGGYALPRSLSVNAEGRLWVVDPLNERVIEVYQGESLTRIRYRAPRLVDGPGAVARFGPIDYDAGFTADAAGDLYLADRENHLIRRIDAQGAVTTWAGSGVQRPADGALRAASFGRLGDLVAGDPGQLYVADGRKLRLIDAGTGQVTTLPAAFDGIGTLGRGAAGELLVIGRRAGQAVLVTLVGGVEQGAAVPLAREASDLADVVGTASGLYVSDRSTHEILALDPATGALTPLVLTGPEAALHRPEGLAADDGRLLVVDNNTVLKAIDLATGAVTRITGSLGALDGAYDAAGFTYMARVAATDAAIFVTDRHAIRRVRR